jgi:hypothetical protein
MLEQIDLTPSSDDKTKSGFILDTEPPPALLWVNVFSRISLHSALRPVMFHILQKKAQLIKSGTLRIGVD